jgi:hypothetical protein
MNPEHHAQQIQHTDVLAGHVAAELLYLLRQRRTQLRRSRRVARDLPQAVQRVADGARRELRGRLFDFCRAELENGSLDGVNALHGANAVHEGGDVTFRPNPVPLANLAEHFLRRDEFGDLLFRPRTLEHESQNVLSIQPFERLFCADLCCEQFILLCILGSCKVLHDASRDFFW